MKSARTCGIKRTDLISSVAIAADFIRGGQRPRISPRQRRDFTIEKIIFTIYNNKRKEFDKSGFDEVMYGYHIGKKNC